MEVGAGLQCAFSTINFKFGGGYKARGWKVLSEIGKWFLFFSLIRWEYLRAGIGQQTSPSLWCLLLGAGCT